MKRIISIVAILTLLLATFAFILPVGAEDTTTTTPFTALRAVRISPAEVVVEFSKPVSSNGLGNTWTSLRFMSMNDGKPVGVVFDENKNAVQAGKKSWRFWSATDHTRIVLTFDAATTVDSFLETTGNKYYDQGYRAFLDIEEVTAGQSDEIISDHEHIYNVFSEDGDKLVATIQQKNGVYDAVCLEIETDFNYTAKVNNLFRAERAIRFSDTKIAVEFSKPVAEGEIAKLKANGSRDIWVSLRWMTMKSGRVVGYNHAAGKQLGISDADFWSDDNHSVIVLTFGNKASVDAFMETTGNTHYDAGCRAYLDFEEVTNDNSGATAEDRANHTTLFGFAAEDGEELATNLPASGNNYDAVVLKVETDYNYAPASDEPDDTTTAPDSDEPDDTTTVPDSDEPDDTTTAPDSDEPDDTTTAPDSDEPDDTTTTPDSDEPDDTTTAPDSDKPAEAPDTADRSALFTSIAAFAALCGAVLIHSKKKA